MGWDLESLDIGELHFPPISPLILKLSASYHFIVSSLACSMKLKTPNIFTSNHVGVVKLNPTTVIGKHFQIGTLLNFVKITKMLKNTFTCTKIFMISLTTQDEMCSELFLCSENNQIII